MTKKNIKKYYILLMMLLLLFIQGCKEANMELDGRLMIPMEINTDTKPFIYSINLNDQKLNKYIHIEGFENYSFPFVYQKNFYCVAQNKENNYWSILKVSNNEIAEICSKPNRIYHPSFLDENSLVFILEEGKNTFLYKYDIASKNIQKLYSQNINKDSKPIISSDGSILFVTEKEGLYNILLIDNKGNVTEVVNGRYPIWLENSKKLIYYNSRNLRLLDIDKKKDKIIKKDIGIYESPELSPDGKYIAFYEWDSVGAFADASDDFLSIMEISSGKKIYISAYDKTKSHYYKGILWL